MKQENFQFTENIYTGKKSKTLKPIDWFILAIATTIDTEREDIYVYDIDHEDVSDAGEDFLWFKIDSHYINALRRSPEYHDAVYRYILTRHCKFADAEYRFRNFADFETLMEDNGVIGIISIYQKENKNANALQ